MAFHKDDRVELKEDMGSNHPALKKGRKGKVTGFPLGVNEAMRVCYVKFDRYTGGEVTAPYSKLKKI